MLVLHYTGMPSAAAALARLCDPAAKVSAHYLIDEDGTVVGAGARGERAPGTPGVSWWQGRAGLNDVSVGIELVNPGPRVGLPAVPRARRWRRWSSWPRRSCARWRDPAGTRRRRTATSRPTRKEDPGELFDWRAAGAGGDRLWPRARR